MSSTKTVIDRGSLTDLLITTLTSDPGFPVGDGEAPGADSGAGWSGEPNVDGSTFTPYLVLTPQTATISIGSMRDPQDGFQIPYSLASFGVSRKQTEALANRARKAIRTIAKTNVTLDGAGFYIQQVWFGALGAVGRVDATTPSTFGEVDTVTVWLTQ